MSNTRVPQKLPPDHLAFVQTSIAAGDGVAGDDLLLAIEQSIQQPLSEVVRKIVGLAIIPAVKTRGRPPKFGVLLDLALDKVDHRYPALLRYEKRKKKRLLKSGEVLQKGDSPSMLAYERLLRHMKDDFGPMTPGIRRIEKVVSIPQKTTSIPKISRARSSGGFLQSRNHNYSADFTGLHLSKR